MRSLEYAVSLTLYPNFVLKQNTQAKSVLDAIHPERSSHYDQSPSTYCSYIATLMLWWSPCTLSWISSYTTIHNLADIANIKFKVAMIQISCNIYRYSVSVDVIDPSSDCKASAYNEGW